MARTSRITIDNGIYHVTSRISDQNFLLEDPELKDKIATWIYGAADFAGINVLTWCIMKDHFHLLIHVPSVPKEYFPASKRKSKSQTGFMMSDEEMIQRLYRLEDGCSPRKIVTIDKRWKRWRKAGRGDEVEKQKEKYYLRMYDLSQYVKVLKERITLPFYKAENFKGHLWNDRFRSRIVDDELKAKVAVAAYIDWTPAREKIVSHAKDWAWCSFGCAMGTGLFAEQARKGYEMLFNCSWEDARERMEKVFKTNPTFNRRIQK